MNTFFIILAVYFILGFIVNSIRTFFDLLEEFSKDNEELKPTEIDIIMAFLASILHPLFMVLSVAYFIRQKQKKNS